MITYYQNECVQRRASKISFKSSPKILQCMLRLHPAILSNTHYTNTTGIGLQGAKDNDYPVGMGGHGVRFALARSDCVLPLTI